jgi:hypothetical protein
MYYTPEILSNLVFEDLRKPKAPNIFTSIRIVLHIHKTSTSCYVQSDFLECRFIQDLACMSWSPWNRDDAEKDR